MRKKDRGRRPRMEEKLSPEEKRLLREAAKVRRRAYAPYSCFRVGAALLGKSGKAYVGCNVENASYGATICAERSALLQAVAAGERRFRLLVLICDTSPPAAPCGLCRQVLAEFGPHLPILLANPRGQFKRTHLHELLPSPFSPHGDDGVLTVLNTRGRRRNRRG